MINACVQQGAFCYAGLRTYPHRHIAIQLQSKLNEPNRVLEYTISSIFDLQQYRAEVTQHISTAESPGRDASCLPTVLTSNYLK